MKWKTTLAFLISLIASKYVLNQSSVVEAFEFIFLISTVNTLVVLPYYAFYRKEYILEIDDKEAGLRCA